MIAVREQAWRFLSRRAHSVKELQNKLYHKGFEPEKVTRTFEFLKQKKYLDDEKFARQFIHDEINIKRSGPLLIKNKLLKKGINIQLADELIVGSYDTAKQIGNCQHIALKKYKSLKAAEPGIQKTKLGKFLVSKGFTWEMVANIIKEIFQNLPDKIELE